MKQLLFTCLFAACYFLTSGQTLTQNIHNKLLQKKDLTGKVFGLSLDDFDFSPLFLHTDNSAIYGFIGDDYQRIRIKFITVSKNLYSPDIYLVSGKSMVKNNICEFSGAITISNIKKYKTVSYGVDDEYKNKGIKGQYVILGNYNFTENETQAHSGTFKGVFQSNLYLDKNNKVHYDDIDLDSSDGYTNNQFVGQWISYDGDIIKRCNWGDYRIPNSGDLDIGAGVFSPGKYGHFGWQTVNARYGHNKKTQSIEEAKWWQ